MAEKTDDLNLPTTVVTRIIKEALPDGCIVAKEAKLALARAASVFVLYLTAQANNFATERNKKTITHNDVIEALNITEFGRFQEPLNEALHQFRQLRQDKKEQKQSKDDNERMDDEQNELDDGTEDIEVEEIIC